MNNAIDQNNSKLDVEIVVTGSDEKMLDLLTLISERVMGICVAPVLGFENGADQLRRRITFSIKVPTNFRLETALVWLNSLDLYGLREVKGTITKLHD